MIGVTSSAGWQTLPVAQPIRASSGGAVEDEPDVATGTPGPAVREAQTALAREHPANWERYTEAKREFIETVLGLRLSPPGHYSKPLQGCLRRDDRTGVSATRC